MDPSGVAAVAALEVAEANHRSAQNSVAQFRRCILADDVDSRELYDAFSELHNTARIVRQVGPDDVSRIAFGIMRRCQVLELHVMNENRTSLPTREERAEMWRTEIAPHRDEWDEAIKRVRAALWA